MISVPHTVTFVTDFNENHPAARALVSMEPKELEAWLIAALRTMITKEGWLEKANEGSHYAEIRLATKEETNDNSNA
jgi:hypothetical protein